MSTEPVVSVVPATGTLSALWLLLVLPGGPIAWPLIAPRAELHASIRAGRQRVHPQRPDGERHAGHGSRGLAPRDLAGGLVYAPAAVCPGAADSQGAGESLSC